MKTGTFLLWAICISVMVDLGCCIPVCGQNNSVVAAQVMEEKSDKLPLLFRQNMGQWDDEILFAGSGSSANIYFMKNELSFGFSRPVKKDEDEEGSESETIREAREIQERIYNPDKKKEFEYLVWNVRFVGANANSFVSTRGKADSRANYFLGNDPKKHCVNVPDHRLIIYENIYSNIDLKYYGTNDRLKYDFVVKPNANVGDIKMNYAGIQNIRISKNGELILSTPWGKMKEERPFTYQWVNGKRSEIKSSYVLLNDSTVGFRILQEYDREQELIIDPIVLDWSTFVAGTIANPSMSGQISKVTIDAGGNVYAVGSYNSTFPTTPGSYSTVFGGGNQDVFVFKLNPTGTALVYSTYIGGNQSDNGTNLYVNAAGETYLTGQTSSFNWPTTAGAYDVTGNGGGDIFITKLNAAGTAVIFSTFLGGSNSDMGMDITLDATGNVYVTGNTSSANYPTSPGAFQTVLKGYSDLIATKLNATGSTLIYSTLIGSSKNEYGVGIGVNAAGEATIGGNTDSLDFPTTAGAYDQTFNDAPNIYNLKGDMAVVKFNATGTGLVYSTFLGGNIGDNMQGFYLSANDEAFVCGVILFSNNFPITPGVLGPTTANGTFDSFVTRFNSTGSALIYSTYMGNADQSSDEARDIWVNACDEAYVTGDGGSFATFPVTAPCATCTGGEDIYLCKLSPTAASFVWSTFVGSKGWDVCQAIGVYVGSTKEDIAIGFGSSHFTYPTTAGVFQQIKPIPNDSTTNVPGITKYSNPVSIGTANAGPDITICPGAVVTLTGNAGATAYSWNPGGQSTSSIAVSPSSTTSYTLTVTNSCGTLQDSVKVTVSNSIAAAIGGNMSICAGQSTTLTASGGSSFVWSTGASTAVVTISPTASTTYSVIVSSGSCPADTAVASLTVSSPPNASITGNSVLCSGQNTTLTASGGGTYSWNTGSSATSIVINPIASTNYTVTVNSGGCTATATQSVTVLPGITLAASSTQTGCTVNNGTATGTPSGGTSPFTYSWSNGQSGQIASGLAAGNYTVTVTDAAGCSKTQTVSVTSNSTLSAAATSTQTGCSVANGTASATASSGTAPYTYAWSNGSSTQAISGLAAGNYSVVITDANGCTKAATASVSAAPGPVATATATATTITAGGNTTLSSTGGGTYSWSPATGLSCTTCSNPTATPGQTTEYCVVVTDANGCSDSACITIVIDVPCGTIYIPNAFSPNNDLENDLECVMGACIDSMHIVIFDRWGEKVFESSDQKICWDGTYKGKSLGTAVFTYYLEATMENKDKVIQGNVSLVR